MEKKNLTQVIDKYHLNGLVESVTWNSTEDDGLTVKFVTATKDCAGSVTTTTDLGLGENDISIYSTSQFNKLLTIMDMAMVNIDVVKGNQGIPYQLSVKDNDFDLTYHLASSDLIPSVPTINEPEEYNAEFSIDEDFVKNFTKAHGALDKPTRFELETKVNTDKEKIVELTVGDGTSYANKIKMTQPADFTIGGTSMPFSANVMREILAANKSAVGKAQLNEAGLMKMTFTEDNTTSTYFMVRLAE
jgi:hypothetical protein